MLFFIYIYISLIIVPCAINLIGNKDLKTNEGTLRKQNLLTVIRILGAQKKKN